MDKWVDVIYPQLIAIAKYDTDYQIALKSCREIESEYTKLYAELTTWQMEVVETYLAACEQMDYRLMQLAYQIGQEQVRK